MTRTLITSLALVPLAFSMAACGQFATTSDGYDPNDNDDFYFESVVTSSDEALMEDGSDDASNAPSSDPFAGSGNTPKWRPACLSVSTAPSPLGLPLPETFNVTWEFDDCLIALGVRQSGVRSVDTTRNADWTVRDFTLARDITRNFFFGGRTEIDTTASLHAEGTRAAGSISRTLDLEEHRVRYRANGDILFDIDVSFEDLASTDTYDANRALESRVVSGTAAITGNRVGATATAVLNDVSKMPALCCYPMGGSIDLTVEDANGTRDRSYTFTETCGQVNVDDGRVVELPACP